MRGAGLTTQGLCSCAQPLETAHPQARPPLAAVAPPPRRSLNWFVQTELLVQVGAPQQAMERTVGKFFELIEWFERHVLGWTLPGDAEAELGTSRVYEVLQNYTPQEAAYTFYQLKCALRGR